MRNWETEVGKKGSYLTAKAVFDSKGCSSTAPFPVTCAQNDPILRGFKESGLLGLTLEVLWL